MLVLLKYNNHLRIPDNNDWVIFSILACILAYIFMLLYLQHESTLREFLTQNIGDFHNGFLTWIICSLVYTAAISVLLSQYVSLTPNEVAKIQFREFQLNKFGFIFTTINLFYLLKTTLTYLYYHSVGSSKKWTSFYFVTTKFYFVMSIISLAACIVHYYLPIDRMQSLRYYLIFLVFVFIFKMFFYFFNKNDILPEKWYYKFLYICTLQIVPVIVLWKILFI